VPVHVPVPDPGNALESMDVTVLDRAAAEAEHC
jgi:hypothetical protein